ncbi:MAG: cobalamin-binding protein [Chloroflexi bacterium]|nr:MAG: cobalamin-binding protein [Chloroflexota bacterium]
MSESTLDQVYEAILDGNQKGAQQGVQTALDAGIAPEKVLNEGMIPAMAEVGQLFEEGEVFVPEMLISARAMQAGLEILRPHLVDAGVEPVGTVAIGTVQGDMHDIGKNLVMMMMEGAGFAVIDLGVDVNPQAFIEAIKEKGAQIVAMSALLTTTMPQIEVTINAIKDAGLIDSVKVMVGGAPVTADYAKAIGADGFAMDASQAATLAKSFVT